MELGREAEQASPLLGIRTKTFTYQGTAINIQ